MNQKKLSSWLKITVVAVALICGIVFFVLVPAIGRDAAVAFSEVSYLFWPCLIFSWVVAGLCYACLIVFYGVCRRIGEDNSFCRENADAMFTISKLTLACAVILMGGLIALTVIKCTGPAVLIGFLLLIFVCVAVSVAAAALSHLIKKAADLQKDSDLTI